MTEPAAAYHCWFYCEEEASERRLFKCMANSTNHALRQLLDREPTATGLSCLRADEEGPRERLPRAAGEKPTPTWDEILAWHQIHLPAPPNGRRRRGARPGCRADTGPCAQSASRPRRAFRCGRRSLAGIVGTRHFSRTTMRNIRQNPFFAFIYNGLRVPIGAGVLFPAFGALLPRLSSYVVQS